MSGPDSEITKKNRLENAKLIDQVPESHIILHAIRKEDIFCTLDVSLQLP